MIKTLATSLLFISLLGWTISSAYAGTDMLANSLTVSNNYLKEAGLVQKKYSGIARKIVSTKVGIPDNLGSEKAEKYREKAENLKEKAEKVKDRAETAKERKEELMARYNELNAKAMEYKAKADSYIAEGMAIQDKYKNYKAQAEGAMADLKDLKSQAEDLKKDASDALDSAKGLKDAAAAKAGLAGNADEPILTDQDKATMEATLEQAPEIVPQMDDAEFQNQDYSDAVELDTAADPVISDTPLAKNMAAPAENFVPAYNQADAIRSAAVLADSVSAADSGVAVSDNLPALPSMDAAEVSVSDVMAAAAIEKTTTAPTEKELPSQFNLEEQLVQSSNRALPQIKIKKSALEAASITNKSEKLPTARNKFGVEKSISAKGLEVQKGLKEKANDQNL